MEIKIGGKNYKLDIQETGGGMFEVKLGDEKILADQVKVAPGSYSILIDGHSYDIAVFKNGSSLTMNIDGEEISLELVDARKGFHSKRASGGGPGEETIKAPMPGKVRRILVSKGDKVAQGKGVIVVEAMKMENELKTQKGGVIKAVLVQEGDTVEYGAGLVVVERGLDEV